MKIARVYLYLDPTRAVYQGLIDSYIFSMKVDLI